MGCAGIKTWKICKLVTSWARTRWRPEEPAVGGEEKCHNHSRKLFTQDGALGEFVPIKSWQGVFLKT